MTPILFGCSGWGYDQWRGNFYPRDAEPSEYLEAYARVFRFVEIDSTYYDLPPRERVRSWAERSPPGFLFSPKVPRAITEKSKLGGNALDQFDEFLSRLAPLRVDAKLGPIVLQLPPSFRYQTHERALRSFLAAVGHNVDLAVELRHASWWRSETYDLLRDAGTALVWSTNEYGRTPPVVTRDDLVYVRFIGDRALDATGEDWSRIHREQPEEIEHYREAILEASRAVGRVFVVANNHFMGNAPETTRRLAALLGQLPLDLARASRRSGQSGLGEYGDSPR